MADALPQPVTAEQRAALADFLRADADRIKYLNMLVTIGALWLAKASLSGEMEKAVEHAVNAHNTAATKRTAYFKMMGVAV